MLCLRGSPHHDASPSSSRRHCPSFSSSFYVVPTGWWKQCNNFILFSRKSLSVAFMTSHPWCFSRTREVTPTCRCSPPWWILTGDPRRDRRRHCWSHLHVALFSLWFRSTLVSCHFSALHFTVKGCQWGEFSGRSSHSHSERP